MASGLHVAERQFRKVIGCRQIPMLLSSMANAVSRKSVAKENSGCVVYELRRVATFNGILGNLSQYRGGKSVVAAFIENYNEHWLIQKLGHRCPLKRGGNFPMAKAASLSCVHGTGRATPKRSWR